MDEHTSDRRETEPVPDIGAIRRNDGASKVPVPSIHLLDGDSDALLFLFEYLSTAGYNVSASSCAADAMMMVAKAHPDVFIADKDLPDMTGREIVQRVQALSPATRVILTTQRLVGELGHQLLRIGDADLVVKPFQWKILIRAVERAVQGSGSWTEGEEDARARARRPG